MEKVKVEIECRASRSSISKKLFGFPANKPLE